MGRSFPIQPNGDRQCADCLQVLPLFDFAASRTGRLGYATVCVPCYRARENEYGKRWYANRRDADPERRAKHEERVKKREADQAAKAKRAEHRTGSALRRSIDRLIRKRCVYGTNVCDMGDRDAHLAASYLLDEFGRVLPGKNAEYKSVLASNSPTRKAEALSKEQRAVEREMKKALLKAARPGKFTEEPSVEEIENALYQRVRYHMKKQRRKDRTQVTFSKRSFASLFGWNLQQLRERLSCTMPSPYSWKDVLNNVLHLDHAIPAAAFDLTTADGVRTCYSLENLQLLTAMDNAIKSVDDAWYAKVFR